MPSFAKISCPKCHRILENWHPSYIKFGNPLITCPNCKTVVRMSHINEWESTSLLKKLDYILTFYGQAILFPGFGTVLVGLIIDNLFNTRLFVVDNNPKPLLLILASICASIFLIRNHFLFIAKVEESRERTKDPIYRKQLGI